MKRLNAQTSTEYIIIIAVVVLIAVVVGKQLSDGSSSSSDVSNRIDSAKSYVGSTGNIAVMKHTVGNDSSIVVIQNNNPYTVQIDELNLSGVNCTSSQLPKTLRIGDSSQITCSNINGTAGDRYSKNVVVSYTNSEIGASYDSSLGKISGKVSGALTTTSGSSISYDPPITDGLVLFWNMQNVSGSTIYDGSSVGNNGTSTDVTFGSSYGNVGSGSQFDGSTSKITISGDFRTPLEFEKFDNSLPSRTDTSSTNGRLGRGTSSSRSDYSYLSKASVIYDVNEADSNKRYKMFYSGTHSGDGNYRVIMQATSPDGMTWTKTNNLIPAQTDSSSSDGRVGRGLSGGDLHRTDVPSVLIDGNSLRMWYSGYTYSGDPNWRIYSANSTDGIIWNKVDNSEASSCDTVCEGNGKIGVGSAGKGDSAHVNTPVVIQVGGIYKMWYAGSDGSNNRIYHATSPDGLVWTKYNNSIPSVCDSVCEGGGRIGLGSGSKGDDNLVLPLSVIYDGGLYKMWYLANHDVWSNPKRIYFAYSEDGLTWIKAHNSLPSSSNVGSNLGRIPSGTRSDVSFLGSASVLKVGNEYKMWYNGNGGYTPSGAMYYASAPIQSISFWYNSGSGWNHIVNSAGGIYLNGILNTTAVYPLLVTSSTLTLGQNSDGSYFTGNIDEVMVFNRSLSTAEVATLYSHGSS